MRRKKLTILLLLMSIAYLMAVQVATATDIKLEVNVKEPVCDPQPRIFVEKETAQPEDTIKFKPTVANNTEPVKLSYGAFWKNGEEAKKARTTEHQTWKRYTPRKEGMLVLWTQIESGSCDQEAIGRNTTKEIRIGDPLKAGQNGTMNGTDDRETNHEEKTGQTTEKKQVRREIGASTRKDEDRSRNGRNLILWVATLAAGALATILVWKR